MKKLVAIARCAGRDEGKDDWRKAYDACMAKKPK